MATQPHWLNDEEQAFWRLMLAANRKIDRILDETLLANSEVSTPEFAVLVSLNEAPEQVLRLRDLCCMLDWDRSRASHQITRMQRRGLVGKRPSACDARGVEVYLTPEGAERLESAAPAHVESVRRVVFDHMSREQFESLRDFCQGVLDVNNLPGEPDFCSHPEG
ncbi:MarR family winged helix-turn-helix transcriptional regulator [Corynebacterium alimapuense]|uniref:MarR family transcriptional regulator n=1 Tax=Corynebacterium alimapuense TaxID=1576874 RepID=A0A3M8K5D8_9CORY|nr:MarR family winged helix-turn-helix transcriptional regulator [Corynebacterium alimapuense]RNE48421.1 MarR family transcriptional regulator [Corynebacterium alimapuense]